MVHWKMFCPKINKEKNRATNYVNTVGLKIIAMISLLPTKLGIIIVKEAT